MNHTERVRATLAGRAVDRPPVSVWGHDFLREWSANDLAAQTIEKQRAYDYDFVKINPRWTMFAEPWGNRYEPPTEQKHPRLLERIVSEPAVLSGVPEVSADHPALAEHLDAVTQVVVELGDEVDCLATLFSPLAVLGLLAGGVGKPLLAFAGENPEGAHATLEKITSSLSAHARALVDAGAAGLFFAPLQWTSLDVCPAGFYAEFGEPYDRKVLGAVADATFNMLHVCGNNIGMSRFYDYPVSVLNWDNFGEGNPSLAEVAEASGKVVAGGLPHKQLHKLDQAAMMVMAAQALSGVGPKVMLTGGCAIGALTEDGPRRAVVAVADYLHHALDNAGAPDP